MALTTFYSAERVKNVSRTKMTKSQKILSVALLGSILLAANEANNRGWFNQVVSFFQNGSVRSENVLSPSYDTTDGAGVDDALISSTETISKKGAVDSFEQARELNDKGVELVMKGKYWQGMFLFKQAIDMDANAFEPRFNLALTLKKKGLLRTAANYFREAEKIDANHPGLLKNYQNIFGDDKQYNPDFSGQEKGRNTRLQSLATLDSGTVIRLWDLEIHQ